MPPRFIDILHLSDLHFNEAGQGARLAESIIRSLSSVDFSFVALTGDFNHKGGPAGYPELETLMRALARERKLDESKFLLIPGNHDLVRPSDRQMLGAASWARFGETASKWYSTGESWRVKEIIGGNHEPLSAYVVDHSPECIFLLFNSYAGIPRVLKDQDLVRWLAKGRPGGNKDVPGRRDEAGLASPSGPSERQRPSWLAKLRSIPRTFGGGDVPKRDDDRTAEIGMIGHEQLDLFDQALEQLDKDNKIPKVALIHHHLFPIKVPDSSPDDLLRSNILIDFPDVIEWLALRSCRCVLHGHRHRPFFGVYNVRPYPQDLVNYFYQGRESKFLFDPGFELIVTGTGSASRHVPDNLVPQLQVVRVARMPKAYLDVKVTIKPFIQAQERWDNRAGDTEHEVFSNDTISTIEKKKHAAECFVADRLCIDTGHPLISWDSRPESDQIYSWFWELYGKARRLGDNELDILFNPVLDGKPTAGPTSLRDWLPTSDPVPKTHREAVLCRLVKHIYDHNRKNSIFEILPFQLLGIYSFASLFFSEKEIEHWAEEEFKSVAWLELLGANRKFVRSAQRNTRDHLDHANDIIAEQVATQVTELRARGRSASPRPLRILEIGFGALRTILYVVTELTDKAPQLAEHIEYLGIDVNTELHRKATDEMNTDGAAHYHRLKAFPRLDERLVRASAHEVLCQKRDLDSYSESVDVVLISYALHHTSNNRLIFRSLQDGSFFKFFGDAAFGDERFRNAIKDTKLFCDAVGDRNELASRLGEAWQRYGRAVDSEKDDLGILRSQSYEDQLNRLRPFFPDRQRELLQSIHRLLAPGGILCLADPNGFSRTFNRQQIIWDWPLAIAHFSDWASILEIMGELGFADVQVWRQIRLKNLQVRAVPVERERFADALKGDMNDQSFRDIFVPQSVVSPSGESEVIDPLEIEDQHLGYVMIAHKHG